MSAYWNDEHAADVRRENRFKRRLGKPGRSLGNPVWHIQCAGDVMPVDRWLSYAYTACLSLWTMRPTNFRPTSTWPKSYKFWMDEEYQTFISAEAELDALRCARMTNNSASVSVIGYFHTQEE